ncbi:MAG: AAA family ATPase [Pseudomonadota bacterium]
MDATRQPDAQPPSTTARARSSGAPPSAALVIDWLTRWADGAPHLTHASQVFLRGDRALKIKRAVDLGFLDFSSLPKRERACRRELKVNLRFAPELYLGVRPILASDVDAGAASGPRFSFGPLLCAPETPYTAPPDAEICEWAVEMRRFEKGAEFDAMADRGGLTAPLIAALADRVAAAHLDHLTENPPPEPGASYAQVVAQVETALAETDLAGEASGWASRVRAALEASAEPSEAAARRRARLARRLHGDLHLGNICLTDGAPTPFDALDFDDRLATIEPLYDVAFTVMDLLWRGADAHAQAFLSRYLSVTRDYAGLRAWPALLSLRASIRAMAATLRGDGATGAAQLHFADALLSPRPAPRLLAVAGLSGVGKSTVARHLAPRLAPQAGAISLSTDVIRKRLAGVAPETTLPPSAYKLGTSRPVYRRMLRDARRALHAGATVVVDGVFARRAERAAARAIAEELGVAFTGVWLQTPDALRLDRVTARSAASERDPSDADRTVAARQQAELGADEPGWIAADASADVEAVCAALHPRLFRAFRGGAA